MTCKCIPIVLEYGLGGAIAAALFRLRYNPLYYQCSLSFSIKCMASYMCKKLP